MKRVYILVAACLLLVGCTYGDYILEFVCDYDIKDVYEIGNGNDDEIAKLILRGGGGTSHIPVYEYIKENLPNTQFLINFTDGYTEYPDSEEVKTLWVLDEGGCDDDNLNWGEIIRLG